MSVVVLVRLSTDVAAADAASLAVVGVLDVDPVEAGGLATSWGGATVPSGVNPTVTVQALVVMTCLILVTRARVLVAVRS
jgi:hypothetical protein